MSHPRAIPACTPACSSAEMPPSPQLHLSFELDSRGSTILRVKAQQPPWRVVRGFDAPSGEKLAHLHNMSGGILDTDALDWRVDVATGRASTAHFHRRNSRVSQPVAPIAWLPSTRRDRIGRRRRISNTCRTSSSLSQVRDSNRALRIELARGASLIWWDMIAPGRDASGEVFGYESLTSTFEVSADWRAGGGGALEHCAARRAPWIPSRGSGPSAISHPATCARRARARRIGARSNRTCALSRIAAPATMYHGELLRFGRTAWWSAASL